MALAPLATTADLADYGITYNTTTEQARVDRFLAAASTAIRDAARTPITQATSTLILTATPADDPAYLVLPGPPVLSVGSVLDDTSAVLAGWKLVRGALWHPCGWVRCGQPTDWTVTYTHGLAEVPADIIGYVCVLVAGALTASRSTPDGSGLAVDMAVASYSIDDWSETYVDPADRPASPFDLPAHVRAELAARFGAGTVIVGTR